MEDSRDRSATTDSVRRCFSDTRPLPPIPAMQARPSTPHGRLGHPEKIIDFGHRGIHEMTRVAKLVVHAILWIGPETLLLYRVLRRRPRSADGGAALSRRLRRHPCRSAGELLDRIAFNRSRRYAGTYRNARELYSACEDPGDRQCGTRCMRQTRWRRDGILNDPRQCHFDPASIECKAGEAD